MDLNYHHAVVRQRQLLAAASARRSRRVTEPARRTLTLPRWRRTAAPAAQPLACATC